MNVLFIDNFDSFSFNLVDEFRRRGCRVEVWRNSVDVNQALAVLNAMKQPKLLVLSPGPGHPRDAGCCLDLVQKAPPTLPIFGICLGHQVIVEAFGGQVGSAGSVIHGKTSRIQHCGDSVFESLPNPLLVGRYHSLAATRLSPDLEVTAEFEGIVMAVAHSSRPIVGVQFHPESILTPRGGLLIDHVLACARKSSTVEAP